MGEARRILVKKTGGRRSKSRGANIDWKEEDTEGKCGPHLGGHLGGEKKSEKRKRYTPGDAKRRHRNEVSDGRKGGRLDRVPSPLQKVFCIQKKS